MITPEIRAEIRRLFYAEHWTVGTIAAELGVHHDAVEHAIESHRFIRTGAQVRPSMVDPFRDFIAATLKEYPRLRATRLHEMLKTRGFDGSIWPVRRYVRIVRPASAQEAYLRLETLPGEQAQVDWGCFGKIQIGNAMRSLSCFVLVLSWSRGLYARFALDQTLESFLLGHVEAFSAIGGVPRQILYDNLKSVVLERHGDHIRFHPRLLEFAGHYHFAPKPCARFRGNEKGKVERKISFLRHSFFAARRFSSVEDLNAQLARWIDDIAHERPVPGDGSGRLVKDALGEECARLLPLPEHPFSCDRMEAVCSGKTPYVRFDLNDYSIPHTVLRKPLTLIASERIVRILDGSTEVARHARSYDRSKRLEDPSHVAALAREKRHAHEVRGRDLLRSVLKNADAFIEALAVRGEPIATHTTQLQKLVDRYGASKVDAALAEVIERGALGAISVAHVLDQRARRRNAPPPLDVVLPNDPRVRDLRMKPHDLTAYDTLSTSDAEEDDHDNAR
jgi:transposase